MALAPIALVCTALVSASPASAQDFSGTCTSPDATVADGFAGSNYIRLRVEQVDSDTTWICYRLSDGGSVQIGGRIDVLGAQTPTQPTDLDADSEACTAASGNDIPGPHPQVAGFVSTKTFFVDTYADDDEAWVCLDVDSDFEQRVIVSVEGTVPPNVIPHQDSPAPPLPAPLTPPAGYPSGTCQSGAVGAPNQLVNADISDQHIFLYTAQPSTTRAHICARVQGLVSAGGMLTVDVTGSPGVTVVPSTSGDLSPCTFPIGGLTSPVRAVVTSSPPGQVPASVCVDTDVDQVRATVDVQGSLVVPTVVPTLDPDTPGI